MYLKGETEISNLFVYSPKITRTRVRSGRSQGANFYSIICCLHGCFSKKFNRKQEHLKQWLHLLCHNTCLSEVFYSLPSKMKKKKLFVLTNQSSKNTYICVPIHKLSNK